MPTKIPLPDSTIKTSSVTHYSAKPLTETLSNGFFTVDCNWTVKYWNSSAEELLGVTAADIIGKNIWEVFAAIIPIEFYRVYQKAFLQNIPVHFQEYWGEVGAWFDVVTYHNNALLSVSFKSSSKPYPQYPDDSSERLKILTELYKFVTEITNDCLWEWNLIKKEIFWIDGGHQRVLGYPITNTLIPQSFWESCVHPDDLEGVLNKLKKALKAGSDFWEDDYRFKKSNAEYAFIHDRAHIIYADGKPARMIGAARDNTKQVLLQKKLVAERAKRQREIIHAVLEGQENERIEIGKELHDNVNQVLAATKMFIEIAKKNPEKRVLYLDKSSSMISEIIEGIRRITKKLILPGIEFSGLAEHIQYLVDDLSLVHPLIINFKKTNINEAKLDKKLQMNIFRIVQEQVNNIIKHSKATHANIILSKKFKQLTLIISDDGVGCNLSKIKDGVGINNIRNRAELCKADLELISKPNEGYSLQIEFPSNKTKK
jgi:PAS domain S-box-containing protein